MISPASRHSNIHLSQTAHTAYRAWEGENKLATPPVTVPVRASNKIEMPPKCHLVFDIIAFWGVYTRRRRRRSSSFPQFEGEIFSLDFRRFNFLDLFTANGAEARRHRKAEDINLLMIGS